MFCAFHNEHILIARVFYIEHKSGAKVQYFFELTKYILCFLSKSILFNPHLEDFLLGNVAKGR